MKRDGQTSAVVGSAGVTIATVIGTAMALGTMMQSEHARINSGIRPNLRYVGTNGSVHSADTAIR